MFQELSVVHKKLTVKTFFHLHNKNLVPQDVLESRERIPRDGTGV
jgi:hypothetical protein